MGKIFSRRDFIKATAITAIAFGLPDFSSLVQAAVKDCAVRTRTGIYNGFVDKHGVKTWLGIPYAKPPVGALRWRAPESLEPSNKEFDAKKFGATPLQDFDEFEDAAFNEQGEDCLTLNIWTRGSKRNLPVMVFIPGGGFVGGSSSDPIYNGARLAANHDVVVVTINYRLNIFGFMNFAEIDSSFEDTGYLGIKDQIAALKWVKENILEFSGDPVNITLFGESAGSISTALLMVTPAAQGLFNKAIAQSGHIAFYHTPKYSARFAEEFMNFGGYKNMRELLNKPADELRSTYVRFCETRPLDTEFDYMPTCDGKFLPAHPILELKNGAARGIKLMTGTTAEEYQYWNLYFGDLNDIIQKFHMEFTRSLYEDKITTSEEIYRMWTKNHANESYLNFANQMDWRVGQELMAEYQSAFNDVFFYLFSQKSSNKDLGSCHSIDLPFVFGNPEDDIELNPSKKLIKQVQAAWASFATTGNPSTSLAPPWKPYTADDRQTMEINSKAWICHKDLNTSNLNDLRGVYEEHLLG